MEANISWPIEHEALLEATPEELIDVGRRYFMKYVVGPAITTYMRPLYETEFSQKEKEQYIIPRGISEREPIFDLAEGCMALLRERLEFAPTDDTLTMIAQANRKLSESRLDDKRFLNFTEVGDILREGLHSGVVIPLIEATRITYLEKRTLPELEDISGVMQRKSFDSILLALTKGPNGFLGAASTNPTLPVDRDKSLVDMLHNDLYFFDFLQKDKRPLPFSKAYKMAGGKVIGLSDEYHIAAQQKRSERAIFGGSSSLIEGSSGCPVRHRFEDETGERQEPLVITAKNFVIRALEVAKEQAQQ